MKRTSKIDPIRRVGVLASIALAAWLPGVASADEIMLSEITVIALAIDDEALTRDAVDASLDAALDTIREELRVETESHMKEATTVPARLRLAAEVNPDRG